MDMKIYEKHDSMRKWIEKEGMKMDSRKSLQERFVQETTFQIIWHDRICDIKANLGKRNEKLRQAKFFFTGLGISQTWGAAMEPKTFGSACVVIIFEHAVAYYKWL